MMHRDYSCDVCRKGPLSDMHYVCKSCDYDLCQVCAPEIAVKPTTLDPASIPKCKNDHTCTVISDDSGYCSSSCPNSWRGSHWACKSCDFHWCTTCHSVPREAVVAATLLAQIPGEVFVHGGDNANWEHQKLLVVFYKNVVNAVKAAPAGSISKESVDKTLADNDAVCKRFQDTCFKEVKHRFDTMSENDKHSVNVVQSAGADVEKTLTQLCATCPAAVGLAVLRKAMLEAAKKWESETGLRRDQEKAKMQLDWVDSHAPGGTVTVGSDSWVFTVEKPYAKFKHTARPELSFQWLVYTLPYGNFTMQCAPPGENNSFGLMRFTLWEGVWTLRYNVQAANVQSEWLTLKWKEGEEVLVSQSPDNPSWRIKPDGVEACSESPSVPHPRAVVVSGKVPFPLCIFAAACFPMMHKISAWAVEAINLYEKQLEKERRQRGW